MTTTTQLWAVLIATGLMSVGVAMAAEPAASTPEAAKTVEVKAQTTCPVMGGDVDKKLFVDAQGKRIYVCCGGCVGEVKKDPAKYITKLEAAGVTLDPTPAPAAAACPAAGKAAAPKDKRCH